MSIGTKIIIFAVACCSTVPSFGQVADFVINISTPQSSVRTGTDIPLEIKVNNVSNRELPILVSPGESGIALAFDVNVFDESMEKVPETDAGFRAHGKTHIPRTVSGGTMMIAVGGEHKSTTHLNEIFNLSKPGIYTVQVQKFDKANNRTVKSNIIKISITP
jgi:hypothetical protein